MTKSIKNVTVIFREGLNPIGVHAMPYENNIYKQFLLVEIPIFYSLNCDTTKLL